MNLKKWLVLCAGLFAGGNCIQAAVVQFAPAQVLQDRLVANVGWSFFPMLTELSEKLGGKEMTDAQTQNIFDEAMEVYAAFLKRQYSASQEQLNEFWSEKESIWQLLVKPMALDEEIELPPTRVVRKRLQKQGFVISPASSESTPMFFLEREGATVRFGKVISLAERLLVSRERSLPGRQHAELDFVNEGADVTMRNELVRLLIRPADRDELY